MKARDADRSRAGEPRLVDVAPHGTLIVREPHGSGPPRRVLELDPHEAPLTSFEWTDDSRLAHAWIKVTDDSWVMIEPRAAYEPTWGLCDRLWHAVEPSAAAQTPLTLLEAVAYEAIDRIPVVLEPARLPVGVGTAVLNLVATLAADAGRARVSYRGPYPTEALFLALLESFRYHTSESDPLAAFMAGRLEWSPAPHERACPAPGVTVHLRERVEKVVWRTRVYHRPDWQGVHRHAPRRVRDADGAVVCSLWALGEAVEDHLRLDPGGKTVEFIAPRPPAQAPRLLPDAVRAGVASAAAALGAVPLAPFVRDMAERYELRWASLDGDLVAVERDRVSVSYSFREALARKLRPASTRPARLALGLAAVTEIAHLIADPLRSRAQSHLSTLSPDAQARILARGELPASDTEAAKRIAQAADALVTDTASDQP